MHTLLQIGQRRDFLRDFHRIQRKHSYVFLDQVSARPCGNGCPDLGGIGLRTLHENHSVIRKAGQRIFQVECVDVVEWNELDMLELGVNANVVLRDGQIIRGRQSLLFRTVFRIRLHVHAEYFAGDGRDDLVRRDRTVTANGVAAHRERAGRANVRIVRHGKGRFVFDSDREVDARAIAAHILGDSDEVAGANIAAAQSGRTAEEARHVIEFRIAWSS